MKTLFTILALCLPFLLNAQQTISWKGGTPGKTTNWEEARNWDKGRVPGPDTKVIIARADNGHYAQPVISSPVQIAELELQSGAELTINSTGQLTVDGANTYSRGIVMQGGRIIANGKILLREVDIETLAHLNAIQLPQEYTYYSTNYDFSFTVASFAWGSPSVEKTLTCEGDGSFCTNQ
jgi:hypothetical protein